MVSHQLSNYDTAQLQGSIHMHLERVQDMYRMCLRYIRNMWEMCPEGAWDTSVQVQNLAIKLQQGLN